MALQVMMKWGRIKFYARGVSYDSLKKAQAWNWAELERFGREPTLHFTGKAAPTVVMDGTIKTFFGGVSNPVGIGKIKALVEEAERKVPLPMVTGLGDVLGLFVCTEVSETHQELMDNGAFLTQPFSVTFKKYPEEDRE